MTGKDKSPGKGDEAIKKVEMTAREHLRCGWRPRHQGQPRLVGDAPDGGRPLSEATGLLGGLPIYGVVAEASPLPTCSQKKIPH